MNRLLSPINNPQGSVMALALMVMATLTIVGLFTINDTVIESTIARNHTLYRQTLYLAEAAVREAVQMIEDYADGADTRAELAQVPPPLTWMQQNLPGINANDIESFATGINFGDFRGDAGAADYGNFQPIATSSGNQNAAGFVVVYEGQDPLDSVKWGEPTNVYKYSVYGRGLGPMRNDRTVAVVKVGYRLRY